jgi:hypothetical protein
VPSPNATVTCTVNVNVPALAGGQTWWVQFTAHAAGQLSSTWTLQVPQSAQLLLYPGNPFTGLADPVATGAKGGFIAKQATTNTANFSVTTAPTNEPAGTYTAQFFNGGSAMGVTTGTITYKNDPASACGPAQLVPPNHIIN